MTSREFSLFVTDLKSHSTSETNELSISIDQCAMVCFSFIRISIMQETTRKKEEEEEKDWIGVHTHTHTQREIENKQLSICIGLWFC